METLSDLKIALRQEAEAQGSSLDQGLAEWQYMLGFDILMRGGESKTYEEFIVPQLSQLLASMCDSRSHVSVLEIGPGPQTILGQLPYTLRRKIRRYEAFEPNEIFATKLEQWNGPTSEIKTHLPKLEQPPQIHSVPFDLGDQKESRPTVNENFANKKFDLILFCHSMYGLNPKYEFIKKALQLLSDGSKTGTVAVFHRDGVFDLGGLVASSVATYAGGHVRILNDNSVLDAFAPFIAGSNLHDRDKAKGMQTEWRRICREFGGCEGSGSNFITFHSPQIMMTFKKAAISLSDLTVKVPTSSARKIIKNREARRSLAASIVRPENIWQVQQCVRWALKNHMSLTIIGGSHSAHCIRPQIVGVDMDAFQQIHILKADDSREAPKNHPGPMVIAQAGCKIGDIISKSLEAGFTVPLGARPSVGAGLWLQGGIGHLNRLYGLTSDAVVGAVLVRVDTGDVVCVGHVPSQHRPADAVSTDNEEDILWALKGAGTTVGIVISVCFNASPAGLYCIRKWSIPFSEDIKAQQMLSNFNRIAQGLQRNQAADAYLYWDDGQLQIGVIIFDPSTVEFPSSTNTERPEYKLLGPESSAEVADGLQIFDADMYISGMHGGHSGGKTSSFKRCVFLRHMEKSQVTSRLLAAIKGRPSPFCYIHLLQGGGAVRDVAPDATAFGCRDWDFACIISGVWQRQEDNTKLSRSITQWVYDVAMDLLPFSDGAYSADLGPDPRDTALAAEAFGPNLERLNSIKSKYDPYNILAHACQLPKPSMKQKLVILVTGWSGAGKDHCAAIWASALRSRGLTVRVVSISDAIKKEYASATGADLDRLLDDRMYKEQHRPSLATFFEDQIRKHPRLLEHNFLDVINDTAEVDVVFITGMRDQAPIATFGHLVPQKRLIEVHVRASDDLRYERRRSPNSSNNHEGVREEGRPTFRPLEHCPTFIFDNDKDGKDGVEGFAEQYLISYIHEDIQLLADMVRTIPNYPRPDTDFRHVLGIAQLPGGLKLCTSLLQTHFARDWAEVDAIATCEAGGFVFASALASSVDVPLALIREAGKLPPPTISVAKPTSYISSLDSVHNKERRLELGQDVIPCSGSIVVVDDVLSTGETMRAIIALLNLAGVPPENISILVVAEFPKHRGRELLQESGFSKTKVQSLLVFDGN